MRWFTKTALWVFAVLLLVGCASAERKNSPNPSESAAVEELEGFGSDGCSEDVVDQNTDNPSDVVGAQTLSMVYTGDETAVQSAIRPSTSLDEVPPAKDAQTVLDEALEFCQVSQDFWGKGDFENAIASLDQAYNLLLQADASEEPKLIQQKEDTRFLICKRMLEIYASQRTVVNGNHNAIPMLMNGHVEKELKLFQGPERQFFLNAYKRSGRYRTEILEALKEAGLPPELSWLPLIESGFKVKALSRARALGPWQFIPSTGYKFGLKRDQWIDERMDVTKSTRAAIAYLQELHRIFGDWSTVLASYNCGEFRVLRVIRDQNINYLDDFWDLFNRLPWETARYVPRFLAALQIINDPEKFGFDLSVLDEPLEYETVEVPKQARLLDIAKILEVPNDELELLNPELRYKVTPPTSYALKVPPGKGTVLTANLDEVPLYIPPSRAYEHHRVRRGDTLSHLAGRYRTSVRAIMQANNLRSANYLRVGQRLKIPIRGSGRTIAQATQVGSSDTSKPLHHKVRRGDSLWLIARSYNTNIEAIMQLNNLKSKDLYIGQTLLVRQGTASEAVSQENTRSYQVKRGDSPYQIATTHNMELERFLLLNRLTPRSTIYPGQMLLVDAK